MVTPITHPISSEEELADAIQKTIEKYSSSLGDNSIIAILDEDGKVIGAQNVVTGEEVRDPRVIQTLQKIATAAVVEIKSMPEDEKSAVRIDDIHSPEVSIKVVRPTAVDDKSIAVPYSGEIKLTPMSQKQRQKFSSLRN